MKLKMFRTTLQMILKKRYDKSKYEVERLLPIGKNNKVIGLMKHSVDGKIMADVAARRPKTYSCLIDDDSEDKKSKGPRKCITKQRLKFEDYKNIYKILKLH